jgi:hypothetical protein
MGESKPLTDALNQSYAAHVFNEIQNAFLVDSLREIGALILDQGEKSASLHHAFRLIKSKQVLAHISADYDVVIPVRHLNNDLDPAVQAEVEAMLKARELERQRKEFDELYAAVVKIEPETFDSDVAKKIKRIRNKAVAHYDFRNIAGDWRNVTIGDAGLKFGDMDAYIAKCTEAVRLTTLLVLRKSMNFDDSREIFEKRVAEYSDALMRGRVSQREEREARRRAARD